MPTRSWAVLKGAESYQNFSAPAQCVLCVHGFGGNPAEMRYFASKLEAAGYSVSVPRLPGHGTSIKDLLSTTRRDWHGAARDAYLECASRCAVVYIAGLSMGGVLAGMLGAEFRPAGLAMISTPHTIGNPAIYGVPLLGKLIKVLPIQSPTLGINDEQARRSHVYYPEGVPLPSTWELHRLIREGMAALPRVRAPAIVIQSTGDKVISAKASSYISRRLGSSIKRQVYFERSNHVIVRDHDRDAVAQTVLDFFAQNLPSMGKSSSSLDGMCVSSY